MARYQQVPANETADEYWRAGLLWFRLLVHDPRKDTKIYDWAMLEPYHPYVNSNMLPSMWNPNTHASERFTSAEYAILVED